MKNGSALLCFAIGASAALSLDGCGALVEEAAADAGGHAVVVDARASAFELATEAAAALWLTHGVTFNVDQPGGIEIDVGHLLPDALAQCGPMNVVYVDSSLSGQAAECAIAHEFGHALGMGHVADPLSLMAEILSLPKDGGCFWSADDEAEFDRVRGGDAYCP